MIRIKKLKFAYLEDQLVFNDLDFQYGQKQKVGIVGPNGSGKTTLFYLMMGLLKPQAGEIEIFNKVRETEKDFEEVRRKIGFLFQNPDHQLFCPTVAEDIAFGPLNLGKSHQETREIVRRTSELLGLEKYIERVSYRLSWGEKRLVSLATVLAMNPEILLLDEPTAGLDQRSTTKVLDYLRYNGHSFIIASHDMNLLKMLTDEIYLLDGGKILY
ncbi:MAG: energy-coupling factor ABC transporter ATP-binding protein [bacterium]